MTIEDVKVIDFKVDENLVCIKADVLKKTEDTVTCEIKEIHMDIFDFYDTLSDVVKDKLI